MRRLATILAAICLFAAPVHAQRLIQKNAPTSAPPSLSSVPIQQPIKPAFLISPLVQRLSARRGQLLEFEFEIESNLKPTQLEISTVGMKQQENGVILPDPNVVQTNILRLVSPASVRLGKGQKETIRCQVRVPSTNNPFLTFGVLVREIPPEKGPGEAGDQPAVGVRFVTQYLLRADIEVVGVRGDSVKQLEIESGQLSQKDGSALVDLLINNPTETAMEYQIRTQLISNRTGKAYKSRLYVPVRANQQEPERYEARILGETKLRMHGLLSESVFPGDYTLKVELLYKTRVYTRKEFPIVINTGDFPAQDATIVRVANDIVIEPPAVALSMRRGGSRFKFFTVQNGSQQKIVARLSPKSNVGNLAEGLVLRPSILELEPGQKRKVLVSLNARQSYDEHSYAFAHLVVSPEVGEAIGSHDIPIALLTKSDSVAQVKTGPLEWKSTPSSSGFEVAIRNDGKRHLSLAGRLQLRDQFGRGFLMEDGYGRWVLPGQKDVLKFSLPRTPPPGTYNMQLLVQQGEGLEPIKIDQTIQLEPTLERVSEKESSGATE